MADARSRKTRIEKAHFHWEFRTQIWQAWLLAFNEHGKWKKRKSQNFVLVTLNGQIVFCAPASLMYLIEAEFTQKLHFRFNDNTYRRNNAISWQNTLFLWRKHKQCEIVSWLTFLSTNSRAKLCDDSWASKHFKHVSTNILWDVLSVRDSSPCKRRIFGDVFDIVNLKRKKDVYIAYLLSRLIFTHLWQKIVPLTSTRLPIRDSGLDSMSSRESLSWISRSTGFTNPLPRSPERNYRKSNILSYRLGETFSF